MATVKEIPIERIKVGEHDVRMTAEDEGITELAASIRRVGILVPLIVAEHEEECVLIAGHRRIRAAVVCGLTSAPCLVREAGEAVGTEISFAENFFRKDLSAVELACAMVDAVTSKGYDVKRLAEGFHKSEHWVRSMLAIWDWPADVQGAVHSGGLSVSAARNLALVTDEEYRSFLIRNAVEQGATARTTAAWLQAFQAMQPPEQAVQAEPVPGATVSSPLIPQAPCLCCAEVFPVDRMSHVPLCGECIKVIRRVVES